MGLRKQPAWQGDGLYAGVSGKGGSIQATVRAGFSLSEKRVTNMESEKPEMNTVMSDWRNQCKLKVLYIYLLAWTLMLRTHVFRKCTLKYLEARASCTNISDVSTDHKKYIVCIDYTCGVREKSVMK